MFILWNWGEEMRNNAWKECLESRLLDWADWYGRNLDHGLGFRNETMEYRLWKHGMCIRGTGKSDEPENDQAEEFERWVVQLYQWNTVLAEAICARYIEYRYLTMGQIARDKLSISVRVFEDRLSQAKNFLAAKLTFGENKRNTIAANEIIQHVYT